MNATFTYLPAMALHAMECPQGHVCLQAVASWSITKSVTTNRRADTAMCREVV